MRNNASKLQGRLQSKLSITRVLEKCNRIQCDSSVRCHQEESRSYVRLNSAIFSCSKHQLAASSCSATFSRSLPLETSRPATCRASFSSLKERAVAASEAPASASTSCASPNTRLGTRGFILLGAALRVVWWSKMTSNAGGGGAGKGRNRQMHCQMQIRANAAVLETQAAACWREATGRMLLCPKNDHRRLRRENEIKPKQKSGHLTQQLVHSTLPV